MPEAEPSPHLRTLPGAWGLPVSPPSRPAPRGSSLLGSLQVSFLPLAESSLILPGKTSILGPGEEL